jgi:hypothetical protein
MTNQETARYETGLRLWDEWTRMWNGQPELARKLVAPRFVLHLTTPNPLDPSTVNDPASVERWVTAHRAKYTRLTFDTHRGPFVDVRAQVVAGPWFADTSVDGVPRPVCGMDTIAFEDGKITEYWTIAKEVDAFGRWASEPAPRE